MPTAIVIPADPDVPVRLEHLHDRDLDAYRRLVDGDLEMLNFARPPACLYFNATGKRQGLPINSRATTLLWIHNPLVRGLDVITGPAFVVGPPDHDGHERSAPPELVTLLLDTGRYRVQVQISGEHGWYSNDLTFTDWQSAYLYGVDAAQRWTAVQDVRIVPDPDVDVIERWRQLVHENGPERRPDEPPFTTADFTGCYSVDELTEHLTVTVRRVGPAFYYGGVCFVRLAGDRDEWLVIRPDKTLERVALTPYIEDGTLASLVHRLLAGSTEQREQ